MRAKCCVCGENLNPSEQGIYWHEALDGYPSHLACDEKTYGEIDKKMKQKQSYKGTDSLL